MSCSRELSTFPFSQNARYKLLNSGFLTTDDLKDFKPKELSRETGLEVSEALTVLEIVSEASSQRNIGSNALDLLSKETANISITTASKALDDILKGGIPMKTVTEICGCPGAGKTQICMQLCVSVQIPNSAGGLQGQAFYIDTEGSFTLQRVRQMTEAAVDQYRKQTNESNSTEYTIDSILKGIYYYPCKSYTELIARINLLDEFLTSHDKIRLVIIDSIAFHFRYGFDGSYSLRSRLLNGIMQTLLKVASGHNVAIVLTNQMTTKITDSGSSHLIPALGESWGHSCAVRLILSFNEEKRLAHLFKSPSMAEAHAYYSVTKDGIRDLPS